MPAIEDRTCLPRKGPTPDEHLRKTGERRGKKETGCRGEKTSGKDRRNAVPEEVPGRGGGKDPAPEKLQLKGEDRGGKGWARGEYISRVFKVKA